jgi:hypothetical protein
MYMRCKIHLKIEIINGLAFHSRMASGLRDIHGKQYCLRMCVFVLYILKKLVNFKEVP